jgi:hypothetical protein
MDNFVEDYEKAEEKRKIPKVKKKKGVELFYDDDEDAVEEEA